MDHRLSERVSDRGDYLPLPAQGTEADPSINNAAAPAFTRKAAGCGCQSMHAQNRIASVSPCSKRKEKSIRPYPKFFFLFIIHDKEMSTRAGSMKIVSHPD
jgi:hypothetical protein